LIDGSDLQLIIGYKSVCAFDTGLSPPPRAFDTRLSPPHAMAPDERRVKCPHCGGQFKPTGIGSHKKSCKKKHDTAAQEDQFVTDLLARTQRTLCVPAMGSFLFTGRLGTTPAPRFTAPWQRDTLAARSLADDSDPGGYDR